VDWVALLFALLVLGIAIPLDVLALDEINPGDELADNPIVAVIVQAKTVRLSRQNPSIFLSSAALLWLACAAVYDNRRAILERGMRPSPTQCSRIRHSRMLPRAHVRRECARESSPATDPA